MGALLGSDSASSSSDAAPSGVGSSDESPDCGAESNASGKGDEGGATPHGSDLDMELPDGGDGAGPALPPAGDLAPHGGGDDVPLPDPVELAEPIRDVGGSTCRKGTHWQIFMHGVRKPDRKGLCSISLSTECFNATFLASRLYWRHSTSAQGAQLCGAALPRVFRWGCARA